MLVEIGSSGETSQRFPFGAQRRQQQNFTIATLYVGGEDRGDAFSGYRLGKDKIPVVKVEPDIILVKAEVANAIALLGVEAGVADRARRFHGGWAGGPGADREDREK